MYTVIKDKQAIISDYNNGFNISKLEAKYGGQRKTLRKILFNEGLINSIEPNSLLKL